MEVATLGAFVFFSESEQIIGLNQLVRTGSCSYANHDIINGKTKLEFVGLPSDKITLNAILRVDLGINPAEQLSILDDIRVNAKVSPFIVGNLSFGKFVIKSTQLTVSEYIGEGLIASANVNIELVQYE